MFLAGLALLAAAFLAPSVAYILIVRGSFVSRLLDGSIFLIFLPVTFLVTWPSGSPVYCLWIATVLLMLLNSVMVTVNFCKFTAEMLPAEGRLLRTSFLAIACIQGVVVSGFFFVDREYLRQRAQQFLVEEPRFTLLGSQVIGGTILSWELADRNLHFGPPTEHLPIGGAKISCRLRSHESEVVLTVVVRATYGPLPRLVPGEHVLAVCNADLSECSVYPIGHATAEPSAEYLLPDEGFARFALRWAEF